MSCSIFIGQSDKVLRELSLVQVDAVRLAPPMWTPQMDDAADWLTRQFHLSEHV